jgi:ankyrin repeat protein
MNYLHLQIFEVDKLSRMTKMLRENKGWTAPHLAAAACLQKCLKSPKMQSKLNEQEGGSLRTPLLIAIELGILESVSTLLELKADATIKDIKDNSVFHIAAGNKSIAIFMLLLEQVPLQDPDLINHLNAAGFSPLHVACSSDNAEVVKVRAAN